TAKQSEIGRHHGDLAELSGCHRHRQPGRLSELVAPEQTARRHFAHGSGSGLYVPHGRHHRRWSRKGKPQARAATAAPSPPGEGTRRVEPVEQATRTTLF